MKKLYFFSLLVLFSGPSLKAQFSGGYSPSKWTTTLLAGSNGSVNTALAPNSITITGSNSPSNTSSSSAINTDFTIRAIASGPWSFNWSYHTNDSYGSAEYDLAGVLINGVFTQLSVDAGEIDQSGSYTVNVTAGTIIGFRISATDNIEGNATLAITNFSPPGGVLPVKLSAFTAKSQGGSVLLQWTAATEINTSHYNIERSAGGTDFRPVGRVEAGSPTLQYSFIDPSPLPGTNLYRLRMEDWDGSFTHSIVRSVNLSGNAALILYPNPATDVVALTIRAESPGQEIMQLYTSTGALLRAETLVLTPGINKKQIDISSLPKGIYTLNARSAGWVQTFVKN
jgi:hypothetical protein